MSIVDLSAPERDPADVPVSDRIYLSDLSKAIDRRTHTIRLWVRDAREAVELAGALPDGRGYLPVHLWPYREDYGHRRIFWAPEQISGIRAFSRLKESRRGWQALP